MRLSEEVRDNISGIHDRLENHAFSALLFSGRIDVSLYVGYLEGLQSVYSALEDAIRQLASDPLICPLNHKPLQRLPAIQADLPRNRPVGPEPIIPELSGWIQENCPASPEHVLAAAYVRYMGDLGGGQVLKRRLQKAWNEVPEHSKPGLTFFDFEESAGSLRDRIREALDNEKLDAGQRFAILSAVKKLFELHFSWFDQLMGAYDLGERRIPTE